MPRYQSVGYPLAPSFTLILRARKYLEQCGDSICGHATVWISNESFQINIAGSNAARVCQCEGGKGAGSGEFQNGFRSGQEDLQNYVTTT